MKTLAKNALTGILLGATLFTFIGIVFDAAYSGNFVLSNWGYTKMAVGSMVVGLGFSLPSAVYGSDKLCYAFKILIHMGIGCTLMLVVAFVVGWIPVESGWLICLLAIGGELVAAFLLWLGFALYNKRLTKRMNERINDMQKGQ